MMFEGIIKERKTWLKALFIILAVLMMWRTVVTAHWAYIPMVILVVLACFFTKEQIVSEDGVDIKYQLFGRFTMHNLWSWDEITTIHTDVRKAAPNVQVHFGRDIVVRTFVMTLSDAKGTLRLAERMNSNIFIDEDDN